MSDGKPFKTGCNCYISIIKGSNNSKYDSRINIVFYGQIASEIENLEFKKFEVTISGDKLYFMPASKNGVTPRRFPNNSLGIMTVGNKENYKKFAGTYNHVKFDSQLGTYYVETTDCSTFYAKPYVSTSKNTTAPKEVVEKTLDVKVSNETSWAQKYEEMCKNQSEQKQEDDKMLIKECLLDGIKAAADVRDVDKIYRIVDILQKGNY